MIKVFTLLICLFIMSCNITIEQEEQDMAKTNSTVKISKENKLLSHTWKISNEKEEVIYDFTEVENENVEDIPAEVSGNKCYNKKELIFSKGKTDEGAIRIIPLDNKCKYLEGQFLFKIDGEKLLLQNAHTNAKYELVKQ